MIRLFIALDFPDSILDRLSSMTHGLPGVRWVSPEQMHLTLRFIGEVENEMFQDIREGLERVDFQEFSMGLKGVGRFGPRGSAGVLWVGVPENDPLRELRRRIDRVLMDLGVKLEKRKFQPHVTLARPRQVSDARLREYLEQYVDFETEPMPVREFILFSSKLREKGAVHEVECVYPAMVTEGAEGKDGTI